MQKINLKSEFLKKWEIKMLLIGVTKNKELVYINIGNRSCNNNHYTITHDTYNNFIDEETGKQNAMDTLEDKEYWVDIGYLNNNTPNLLIDNIDFKGVAEYVLCSDGWEHINGEYEYFTDYNDKDYYMNLYSCGVSIEDLKEEYGLLYITEEEKQILIDSDKLHLENFNDYTKEEEELYKKVLAIKDKYKNKDITEEQKEEIIKYILDEE